MPRFFPQRQARYRPRPSGPSGPPPPPRLQTFSTGNLTCSILKDKNGNPVLDSNGNTQGGKITSSTITNTGDVSLGGNGVVSYIKINGGNVSCEILTDKDGLPILDEDGDEQGGIMYATNLSSSDFSTGSMSTFNGEVTNNFIVGRDVSIGRNATIVGNINSFHIASTGDMLVGANMSVGGGISTGTIRTTGDATIEGNITVEGVIETPTNVKIIGSSILSQEYGALSGYYLSITLNGMPYKIALHANAPPA